MTEWEQFKILCREWNAMRDKCSSFEESEEVWARMVQEDDREVCDRPEYASPAIPSSDFAK